MSTTSGRIALRINGERGIYLVVTALLCVTLLTLIGLAIDGGRLYVSGLDQQRAADAAALTGARVVGLITPSTGLPATAAEIEDLSERVAEDNFNWNGVPVAPGGIVATVVDRDVTIKTFSNSPSFFFGGIVPGPSFVPVPAAASATRRRLAVILVIDRTGSMGATAYDRNGKAIGTKFSVTKDAAKSFARNFVGPDHVGITEYSTTTSVPYSIVKPLNIVNIEKAIDNVPAPNGATNIELGLLQAYQDMQDLEAAFPGVFAGQKYIVLMTDGTPNQNVQHNNQGLNLIPAAGVPCASCAGGLSPAYPPLPTEPECNDGAAEKENFVAAMRAANYVRQSGITLLTVAIGNLEPTVSAAEPWGTSSPWGSGTIRENFMRWLANDRVSAQENADPAFPEACAASYADMNASGYEDGIALISPAASDIDGMFQQTANYIMLHLTS